MTTELTISSAPPARTSMNYAALREGGMELIRQWAAQSWTDHNIHDPGITLLEACSYAMTELGLRVQLDVADLLRSGETHHPADLEPADRVLPVGPVDFSDLRALLLDHPLVNDAQLFAPADSEVPFYQAPGASPPLTYTPGTALVRPSGLYEVLIDFANRDLNSNTYPQTVSSGGQNYAIELALPYWDDPEALPFRQGATVNTVSMVLDGTDVWRPLPEALSFFGKINIAYTTAAGPGTIQAWVLLRITSDLSTPATLTAGILAAARSAVESVAAGSLIQIFAARVRSAVEAVAQLSLYVASWRNLGEQAVRIGVARTQEIVVRARIEVNGGIDLETLLANIFMDIDQLLSPRVSFESLADRRAVVPSADLIYDGPLLLHGFLDSDTAEVPVAAVIYTSDVLRLIMERRSGGDSDIVTQENPLGRDIVAVTDLALSNFINNRPITADADNCLHLVDVQHYLPLLSIAKSQITFVRNDSEVPYDEDRVAALFADLQAQAQAGTQTSDPSPVWPVQKGDVLPVEEYTPIQNDLPSTYGVGNAAVPDSAGVQRQAAVKQLQGYLLLFEQFLADTTAQLGNINRFFSVDVDEDTTCFTRPLFDIPGTQNLLRQFPLGSDWSSFIADPNNPFVNALRAAAESREQFLDRRNRMFDHRLARHAEDTVALGQELHRWALAQLSLNGLTPAQQATAIAARRAMTNARLIQLKAALLHDVPELNAFRLLASSNPFYSDDSLLQMEATTAGFRWHLILNGQEQLRGTAFVASAAQASITAENAFTFAGRSTLYTVVDAGGGQSRLNLMDGTTGAAQIVAESSQTWGSVADANIALSQISAAFSGSRLTSSPAPIERRIAYLTGIRSAARRHLLVPTSTFFEIFDDPPGGGMFGKRWRLWQLPASGGLTLLSSAVRFEAGTDADATALAQQSIMQVIRYGIDEWNYQVTAAAGNTFTYQLQDADGTVLGLRDPPLASTQDAQRGLSTTLEHLYFNYSSEGFYLIEHLLLRPRQVGEAFLALPVGDGTSEPDPYSHRVSIILPSGWSRDFSQARATAATTPVAPDRFRDPEFRGHLARTVQQAFPAHLVPTLYWVDRELAGSASSVASFDTLEQRYFAWLDTVLIPAAPDATVAAVRVALVEALNAIANDLP